MCQLSRWYAAQARQVILQTRPNMVRAQHSDLYTRDVQTNNVSITLYAFILSFSHSLIDTILAPFLEPCNGYVAFYFCLHFFLSYFSGAFALIMEHAKTPDCRRLLDTMSNTTTPDHGASAETSRCSSNASFI